jgi:hypothetical protein
MVPAAQFLSLWLGLGPAHLLVHLLNCLIAEREDTHGARAYRCDQVGWGEHRQTVSGDEGTC